MGQIGQFTASGIDKRSELGQPRVRMVNYLDVYRSQSGRLTGEEDLMEVTCPERKVSECSLRRGDLVFTPSSETPEDIGLSAVVDREFSNTVFSYHLLRFRFEEDVDHEFKRFVCRNAWVLGQLSEACKGTTRKILTRRDFDALQVLLPPKGEQHQIGRFLASKTDQLDRLISRKQRLIDLLTEYRTAIINRAVTNGLDPNAAMKDSGIEWLGVVPAHWQVVQLKRTARDERSGFTDGDWVESPYITEDGVRLIQTGNVGVGMYREKGFRYISDESFSELKCTEVEPGDVLICRLDGPVGRACLAPELGFKMITSVDNTILKPSKRSDARYLVYVMSSQLYLNWIDRLCQVGGGFRFRVSRSMLGDVRIPFPPTEEQTAIADSLDSTIARLDLLTQREQQAIVLLQELRTSLISEVVTGKIDVRDAVEAEAVA
jgi:type I restriction enzyme S subunit